MMSAHKAQDLAAFDMLLRPVLQLHVSVEAGIMWFGEISANLSE